MSFFMEIFSTIDRPNDSISSQGMAGLGLAAIVAAVLFSSGCGKSQSSTAQTPMPPPAANSNQAPTAAIPQTPQYPLAPVVFTTNANGTPDLKTLNQAYIGWIMQYRRRPKDLDEFVALSGIKLPPPPVGKKYVVDRNGFINFVNQ
jgi:hypothetical protein